MCIHLESLFIMLHYGHAEASPDADVVYVQQEPSGLARHGQARVWTLLLSQYATTGTNRWRTQVPLTTKCLLRAFTRKCFLQSFPNEY